MAMQEKFVQAGEYRTHYWEVGAGENVLMLHSADPGSGGWLEFRENMEALGRQFRVLAPDIIGFGKTDSPTRDLRHPAYVEHMVQFLDALGVKKTHLIGNCRGGLISISIAAEHPDRVGRLILIGNAAAGYLPSWSRKRWHPTPITRRPGKISRPISTGRTSTWIAGRRRRSSINISKRARVNTAPMPSWAATRWMCPTSDRFWPR